MGFGLNPAFSLAPPILLFHWREGAARENLRNVDDRGEVDDGSYCQQKNRVELARKSSGSPEIQFSNYFST